MRHATQVSKNCIATFRGEFFGDPRASPPRAPTDRIVQEPGYALRSALGVTRETQVPSRPCHSLMRVRLKRDLSPVKGLRGAGDSSRVTSQASGAPSLMNDTVGKEIGRAHV